MDLRAWDSREVLSHLLKRKNNRYNNIVDIYKIQIGDVFMSGKYNFYYDESEHSRKINKTTISAGNYYDNFVTVAVGWKQDNESMIEKKYDEFEKLYEARKSKGELKSTTLRPKDFKYGFTSLNADGIQFVSDFLEIFDESIFVYFSVTSKIEYVINQLFINYHSNIFQNVEMMKYAIVKSIIMYQPEEIINGMYDNPNELIQLLKRFYEKKIDENKLNLKLKKRENESFSQIVLMLDDINENISFDWNYSIAFHGFSKYVEEQGFDEIQLLIDKEGEYGNTLNAAKSVGISNAQEIDSKESFGVRMADMFAGLLSKLLKALHNGLRYNNPSEYLQKKILSEEWFKLSEQQFLLYKKMKFVLLDLNHAWYKSYAGIYVDDLMCLANFLNYIGYFDSLTEFNKCSAKMHGEQFNSCICYSLENYFKEMSINLPIKLTERNNSDFFYNERGAKVYYDVSKQKKLDISDDAKTYQVLSVGFLGMMEVPYVTIMKLETPECYILPMELMEWVVNSVSFSNMGMNVFPAEVRFYKDNGQYYADIL